MDASMTLATRLKAARWEILNDIRAGFWMLARRGVALSGVLALTLVLVAVVRPDVRLAVAGLAAEAAGVVVAQGEAVRDVVGFGDDSSDTLRTAAAVPLLPAHALPREQQAAALFLARKYRLAPDGIAAIVREAYDAGRQLRVDPLLILAVMSIESAMNPFAQSHVGAQGLMQVMTSVHSERFDAFGGPHAALDPLVNVRVGAGILKELIDRYGSVEAGLKAYVGAAALGNDSGYGLRVLTERARLESAVKGVPLVLPAAPPAQATEVTDTQPDYRPSTRAMRSTASSSRSNDVA